MPSSLLSIHRMTMSVLLALTFVIPASLIAQSGVIPQRSDIDDKYKWDLSVVYATLDDWEADFKYVEENYPRLETYKGRLSESAEIMYEFFKLEEEIDLKRNRLRTYSSLKLSEDNRDSQYQELSGRIGALKSRISHVGSFKRSELLAIDPATIESFISSHEGLAVYRFYFEKLERRQEHILSEKEEAILALSGSIANAPGQIYSMLSDADMAFGEVYDEDSVLVELTQERYAAMRKSPNRRVRRDSHEALYGEYKRYENTMAASLGAALKTDYFYAQARGHETCLEASLSRRNIPTDVYYNLIETVNNNLEPLHKWARLKKETLGVDTLRPYDLYVPLISEQSNKFTYEEAMDLNLAGLAAMGDEYMADYEEGLKSRWVDVFETKGKSTGAFSGGSYTTPPYILLNYNGTLDWVFTLAHEMGHSMQSLLVRRNEPFVYANYSTFVAEVASTGCESVLMKHLLKEAKTKEERMFLLNNYIQDIRTTFFRQIMFAEFELAIHTHMENGGAFSSRYFRKTFSDIYQKYWGEALEVDDLSGMLSLVVPHFYYQYYVYQYATSFAAAQLLTQKIADGDQVALDSYIEFLSTGSSGYPVDVLKKAGVDMTQPEPILHTIQLFSDMVDELEQLLQEE